MSKGNEQIVHQTGNRNRTWIYGKMLKLYHDKGNAD